MMDLSSQRNTPSKARNMRATTKAQNHPSILLSRDENELVFHMVGPRCVSLATAVVQLFLTDPPHHDQWRRKDAGILCLVKDNMRRSYYFRLYCLTRRALIWQQEIYNELEYVSPQSWLHTFEAEDSMGAFNFANEEEARNVQSMLLMKLENKKGSAMRRSLKQQQLQPIPAKRERRSRQSMNYQIPHHQPSGSLPVMNHMNDPPRGNNHNTKHFTAGDKAKRKEKDAKRKLTKADIGKPSDFRHVSHVGWSPEKGFDYENLADQDELKNFLEQAGVSETQLKDKDTREFIYNFIHENGGIDALKDYTPITRVKSQTPQAPPVPMRAPPPINKPPPPPSTMQHGQQRPNQQTAAHNQQRTAPPPPPPPSLKPPPPTDMSSTRTAAPPPPPPPPCLPMSDPAAPSAAANPRSALLESIKSGTTLRHVDVEKKPIGGRSDLLEEIRQGKGLKSVQPIEKPSAPSLPVDGLAGALARALQERNRAFHNDSESDSESSRDDGSDSEWEE